MSSRLKLTFSSSPCCLGTETMRLGGGSASLPWPADAACASGVAAASSSCCPSMQHVTRRCFHCTAYSELSDWVRSRRCKAVGRRVWSDSSKTYTIPCKIQCSGPRALVHAPRTEGTSWFRDCQLLCRCYCVIPRRLPESTGGSRIQGHEEGMHDALACAASNAPERES